MSFWGSVAGAVIAADAAVNAAVVDVAKGAGKAAIGLATMGVDNAAVVGVTAGLDARKAALDLAAGVKGAVLMGAVQYAVFGISCADSGESPLSDSLIYTGVAKEFGIREVEFSEWTRALDDNMAVACNEVVEALNRKARRVGTLSWDNVLKVFCKCQQITKDDGRSKRIKESLSFDEINYFKFDGSPDPLRKREIITWLKTLMNDNGEQDVLDNSSVFTEKTLDRLADNASQSGATVTGPVALFHASDSSSERLMEIAVIRFPTKFNSKIKVYRLQIDSWFRCSRVLYRQHDETGLAIDYQTFVFKPNPRAIDDRLAAQARRNLANPDMFKF